MSNELANLKASLLRAVRNGNLQQVTDIVNNFGLSFSPEFLEGYYLLCNAIQCKHVTVAQVLIEKGAKLNGESDSALHFAAEEQCLEIVEALLNHGAEINCVRLKDLCTPLHLACMQNCSEIVSLLLNGGADPNVKAYDNLTPLLLAVLDDNFEMIELLLKQRVEVNCTRLSDLYTPLHIACERDYLKSVDLLLESGANPNAEAYNNVTPLLLATAWKVVELLLKYGAQINCSKPSDKRTLLHKACQKNSNNCVKYLLKNGADPNARAIDDITPLHLAAEHNVSVLIVKSLLNHGAQVECLRLSNKYTPLHLACASPKGSFSNAAEIVDLLLSRNADPNATAKGHITPLQLAVNRESLKVVQSLLKHGANVNASRHKDNYSPLHVVCGKKRVAEGENNRVAIVEALLQSGADPNAKDYSNNITPLHLATYQVSPEVVKSLLKYGAQVNSWTTCFPEIDLSEKLTPLHLACGTGSLGLPEIVNLLLESGADPNVKAYRDQTPLHLATEDHQLKSVEALIRHGAQVNCLRRPDNYTPLHIACDGPPSVKITRVLINSGADVNSKSIDGTTPFHLAVRTEKIALIKLLLENDADINAETQEGISPFDCDLDPMDVRIRSILKKHVIKLKVACLFVSEHNLLVLQQDGNQLQNFQKKCKKELKKMKSTKFLSSFTLYDLLRCQRNPTFVRNEALMDTLTSFDYSQTPLYQNLLLNRLERCKLLRSGRKWLSVLVKTSGILRGESVTLPDELSHMIVSNINDKDLDSLTVCGEHLKFQLSK